MHAKKHTTIFTVQITNKNTMPVKIAVAYNGITTHSIFYSISELTGNHHLSMALLSIGKECQLEKEIIAKIKVGRIMEK